MDVRSWVVEAAVALNRAEIHSANLEAQVLAAHVLGQDRSWILAHPEADLPELPANMLLHRRLDHEPLAYILGYREFYSREFIVNPSVLIPRQDTETLIDGVLNHPKLDQNLPLKVLDVGTGSGCIAVTLKLERPSWEITATDVSEKALQTAEFNADRLGAAVRFLKGDLFSPVMDERYDLIVSNPPYIGFEESLPKEVRDFEPEQALFSGQTGEEFYARMAAEARGYLAADGRLFVEVGYRQADSVKKLFVEGGLEFEKVYLDIQGHQRILSFVRP